MSTPHNRLTGAELAKIRAEATTACLPVELKLLSHVDALAEENREASDIMERFIAGLPCGDCQEDGTVAEVKAWLAAHKGNA